MEDYVTWISILLTFISIVVTVCSLKKSEAKKLNNNVEHVNGCIIQQGHVINNNVDFEKAKNIATEAVEKVVADKIGDTDVDVVKIFDDVLNGKNST